MASSGNKEGLCLDDFIWNQINYTTVSLYNKRFKDWFHVKYLEKPTAYCFLYGNNMPEVYPDIVIINEGLIVFRAKIYFYIWNNLLENEDCKGVMVLLLQDLFQTVEKNKIPQHLKKYYGYKTLFEDNPNI